ncbi:hypothetical protein Tco_0787846 [Tanacetum coccineum]
MKAICNLDVHVDSKAPKPSLQMRGPPSKNARAKVDSARDKSPSHPLPPTPVVGEMNKEAQQAAGGPTSLGATSKEGAHPQLSSGHEASANSIGSNLSVLVDKTKSARDGLKTTTTDFRYASFTPESLTDEPIIVSNGSKEEEGVSKDKDTEATSHNEPEDT